MSATARKIAPPKIDPHANVATAGHPLDDAQARPDSQTRFGVVDPTPPPKDVPTARRAAAAGYDRDGWLRLRALADAFDDAQHTRIAIGNRLRLMPSLAGLVVGPTLAEKQLSKLLRAEYRKTVPEAIRDWQKAQHGIGDHLLARLLGHLGHPVAAIPHHWEGTGAARTLVTDLPYARTLRQLWAYCGHGDPARRRTANVVDLFAAGNPRLKMLAHLIAEGAIKQPGRRWTPALSGHWSDDPAAQGTTGSPGLHGGGEELDDAQVSDVDPPASTDVTDDPTAKEEPAWARSVWRYRAAYEAARYRYTDRTHAAPCVRCGPSGRPAPEGSPWSMAHQHAAALRLVAKEILRDLWTVAS